MRECQTWNMEGEVREGAMKSRRVIHALKKAVRGGVHMGVRNGIRNIIILPAMLRVSEA